MVVDTCGICGSGEVCAHQIADLRFNLAAAKREIADLRARLAACKKERIEYADKWVDTKYQHAVATQERDAARAEAAAMGSALETIAQCGMACPCSSVARGALTVAPGAGRALLDEVRGLRGSADATRASIVAHMRREAERFRTRNEVTDAAVAAHVEILGDALERREDEKR